MIYLLALTVALTACGTEPAKVDPDLKPYFERFSQDMGWDVSNVSGEFSTTIRPVVAQCISGQGSKIQVDRAYFDTLDDLAKEQLLYHELGHCAFNLAHDDSQVYYKGSYVPASIMNISTFGDWYFYRELRNTYKHALKERRAIKQEEL